MKRYHVIIGGLAAAVLLAAVGTMDATAEQQQIDRYCDMVEQGNWPAYRDDVACASQEKVNE